jgi:toxin YhaV
MLHPLFLEQISAMAAQIRHAKAKDPATYKTKNCSKRLRAILKLAFEAIPADPAADIYRQGHTLGGDHAHWR